MAGVEGVEPSHTAPETAVLPLDDTPSASRCAPCVVFPRCERKWIYYACVPYPSRFSANFFEKIFSSRNAPPRLSQCRQNREPPPAKRTPCAWRIRKPKPPRTAQAAGGFEGASRTAPIGSQHRLRARRRYAHPPNAAPPRPFAARPFPPSSETQGRARRHRGRAR